MPTDAGRFRYIWIKEDVESSDSYLESLGGKCICTSSNKMIEFNLEARKEMENILSDRPLDVVICDLPFSMFVSGSSCDPKVSGIFDFVQPLVKKAKLFIFCVPWADAHRYDVYASDYADATASYFDPLKWDIETSVTDHMKKMFMAVAKKRFSKGNVILPSFYGKERVSLDIAAQTALRATGII